MNIRAVFLLPVLAATLVAGTVHAAGDEEARLAAARELAQLNFAGQIINAIIDGTIDASQPYLAEINPFNNERTEVRFENNVRRNMEKKSRVVADALTPIIARYYTLEEISAMQAFYGSPFGRNLGDKMDDGIMDLMAENLSSGASVALDPGDTIVMSYFTPEEIDAVNGFFTSREGLAVAEKTKHYSDAVMDELTPLFEQLGREAANRAATQSGGNAWLGPDIIFQPGY